MTLPIYGGDAFDENVSDARFCGDNYRRGTQHTTGYTNKENLQHTHPFSGTTGGSNAYTTDAQPPFTGTRGQTEDTGSGSAVDVMNPYIVKYCWERTA